MHLRSIILFNIGSASICTEAHNIRYTVELHIFTLTLPVHLFQASGSPLVILEVGCGVGNFLFPLLEEDPTMFFYACDFSPRAVAFVREHPLYDTERCHAFQCDITTDSLTEHVRRPVDLITMIFVLSAIHPDKMRQALENITKV